MRQWTAENNLVRSEGDIDLAKEDLALLAVRNGWDDFEIARKYERLQQ
jgi:hypothetical protein